MSSAGDMTNDKSTVHVKAGQHSVAQFSSSTPQPASKRLLPSQTFEQAAKRGKSDKAVCTCGKCPRVGKRRICPATVQTNRQNGHATSHREPSGGKTFTALPVQRPPDEALQNFYTLKKVSHSFSEKFQTGKTSYHFSVKNLDDLSVDEATVTLSRVFDEMLDNVLRGTEAGDQVRFYMTSAAMSYDLNLPFDDVSKLDCNKVFKKIAAIIQSNRAMLVTGLQLHVQTARVPKEGCGNKDPTLNPRKRPVFNLKEFNHKKTSVISIENKDDLCLARAIVVAIAWIAKTHRKSNEDIKHYRRVTSKSCRTQLDDAKRLHRLACVPEGPCGVNEVRLFQDFLASKGYDGNKYRIIVISSANNLEPTFIGPLSPDKDNEIYLLFHKEHYDVITKLKAYFRNTYYCRLCVKCHNDKGYKHKCAAKCPYCRDNAHERPMPAPTIHCGECNRRFVNDDCFKRHQKNKTCKLIQRCTICQRIKRPGHDCKMFKCRHCKLNVVDPHECFVQPLKVKESNTVYVYFDVECALDPDGLQVPTLVIAKTSLNETHTFADVGCMEKFCHFLFNAFLQDIHRKDCKVKAASKRFITLIAHYARGYDNFFLLQYIHKHSFTPEVIYTGAKLLYIGLKSHRIRVIDSHAFLPMPLAQLPEAFGFTDMAKGYFPHALHTLDNHESDFECEGLPEAKYYEPDLKLPEERAAFFDWYRTESNRMIEAGERFRLRDECRKYCESDVNILKQSCETFMELVKSLTGINPFDSITLASVCMTVFRTNFLKENTVALVPPDGYTNDKKYSKIAVKWLMWLERSEQKTIQHALKPGGEVRIGRWHVDGYCQKTKEIFEFYGCHAHGCRTCLDPSKRCYYNGDKTNGELYCETMDREDAIQRVKGDEHTVRHMWACEFSRLFRNDKDMAQFCNEISELPWIHPRDGLYGGRVAPNRLYYNVGDHPDTTVSYFDICSLYPFVMKYGEYMVGVPQILKEDYEPNRHYGLVKCTVLPPATLYLPLLPMRYNGKLFFPLCAACVTEQVTQLGGCTHSEKERSFTGVYTTLELKKAVSLGYKVTKTFCIWHYDNKTTYDRVTNTGGLFAEYVNTFLKVKMEASGYPRDVKTDIEKKEYVDMVKNKEGVTLTDIEHRPQRRLVSKLMLNSLWGKLCQRLNYTQTKYIQSQAEYYDLLLDKSTYVVHSADMVNDETVLVAYSLVEDAVVNNSFSNPVLASFVTSHARLQLYDILETVVKEVGGQHLIYYDTDSCIFAHPLDKNPLQDVLGSNLGEMTNELPTGTSITEFVSCGPKSYAYKLSNGDCVSKLKGVTLTHKNQQKVNFESLLSLVSKGDGTSITTTHRTMKRDKVNATVKLQEMEKVVQFTFDKGVVGNDYIVYPYGYKGPTF